MVVKQRLRYWLLTSYFLWDYYLLTLIYRRHQ